MFKIVQATSGFGDDHMLLNIIMALAGLGGPDMADGSFHFGAQRFGVNGKSHYINPPANTGEDEEL